METVLYFLYIVKEMENMREAHTTSSFSVLCFRIVIHVLFNGINSAINIKCDKYYYSEMVVFEHKNSAISCAIFRL